MIGGTYDDWLLIVSSSSSLPARLPEGVVSAETALEDVREPCGESDFAPVGVEPPELTRDAALALAFRETVLLDSRTRRRRSSCMVAACLNEITQWLCY